MRLEAFSRPLLCAVFCAAFGGSQCLCRAAEAPPANPQASALVKQALEAEAQGKMDQRDALATQALQLAPNRAAAHWIAGQVQQSGRWVSIEDAAAQMAKNEKLDEYRQKRDALLQRVEAQRAAKLRPSAADQVELAHWCDKAGLKDHERFHLLAALQTDRRAAEARRKLGLVEYRGSLMPADQVDDFDARAKKYQSDFARWKDRFQSLRKQIENGRDVESALAQIRSIHDVSAIPALEAVLGNGKSEAAAAVVECLIDMPQQEATESLVRFAVSSSSESVRKQAAYALNSRSMFAYVPVLLAGLRTPNNVNFQWSWQPNGAFGYRMTIYREGLFSNSMYTASHYFDPRQGPLPSPNSGITRYVYDPSQRAKAVGAALSAERRAADLLGANEEIGATNERITSALQTATGVDQPADALGWWHWWYQFNEYYETNDVPTEYISETGVTTNFVRVSCFVAGTPIWTETGLVQIEKIRPGDSVLSQNIETGELALKPVLATTTRPPSSLVNIQIGENIIRCTRGHPFWVSGAGWKMAKELKAGDWLHTVRGAVPIDNVDEKDEDVCYNLVVADFDSYFIGKDKVLVHDNNLRVPTDAIVPGLLR